MNRPARADRSFAVSTRGNGHDRRQEVGQAPVGFEHADADRMLTRRRRNGNGEAGAGVRRITRRGGDVGACDAVGDRRRDIAPIFEGADETLALKVVARRLIEESKSL